MKKGLEIHNLTVYVHCAKCNEPVELGSVGRVVYSPTLQAHPEEYSLCQDCIKKFQEWFNCQLLK